MLYPVESYLHADSVVGDQCSQHANENAQGQPENVKDWGSFVFCELLRHGSLLSPEFIQTLQRLRRFVS